MIRIKQGVRLSGLRPEILLAATVAESVWAAHGAAELVITSGIDGKHKSGSKHALGLALDFRTHNIGVPEARRAAVLELKDRLGAEYDVLLENDNTSNEHAHVEHDPKEPA